MCVPIFNFLLLYMHLRKQQNYTRKAEKWKMEMKSKRASFFSVLQQRLPRPSLQSTNVIVKNKRAFMRNLLSAFQSLAGDDHVDKNDNTKKEGNV